jgi:hypothetical protein
MNALARAASYAAQSRVRRAGAMAEAAGGGAKVMGVTPAPKVARGSVVAAVAAPAVSASVARVTFSADAAAMADDGDDEDADEGEEGDADDDAEMDGDDDDEDDDEYDDGDDEEEGGASMDDDEIEPHSAPAFVVSRLPVFEDPSSHLLFKRLLQRESVAREREEGATSAVSHGGGKRRRDEGVAVGGDASGVGATAAADAVLGRLLLQRLAGSLAKTASSNRACLVIVELLRSSDLAVAAAVRGELAAHRAVLAAHDDCAGKEILLQALLDKAPTAAAATPSKAKQGGGSRPTVATTATLANKSVGTPASVAPKRVTDGVSGSASGSGSAHSKRRK